MIKGGLDIALAKEWVDVSWERLEMDKHDPEAWDRPSSGLFLRLEPSLSAPMKEAAPRVYGAICDLVGGADRLDICTLTDTMIMNLGGNTEQPWTSPLDMARSGTGGWVRISRIAIGLCSACSTTRHQLCANFVLNHCVALCHTHGPGCDDETSTRTVGTSNTS